MNVQGAWMVRREAGTPAELKLRIDGKDAWIFEPKAGVLASGAVSLGPEFNLPDLQVVEGGRKTHRISGCTTDRTVYVLVVRYCQDKLPTPGPGQSIEIQLPRPEDLEKEWKEARNWVRKRAPWNIRVEEINVAND